MGLITPCWFNSSRPHLPKKARTRASVPGLHQSAMEVTRLMAHRSISTASFLTTDQDGSEVLLFADTAVIRYRSNAGEGITTGTTELRLADGTTVNRTGKGRYSFQDALGNIHELKTDDPEAP